jgi:hypothetical protein
MNNNKNIFSEGISNDSNKFIIKGDNGYETFEKNGKIFVRPKWNKIHDKPKSAGLYLVIADWMGVVEKGEFDGKDQWICPFGGPIITHWMLLPKPPNEYRFLYETKTIH